MQMFWPQDFVGKIQDNMTFKKNKKKLSCSAAKPNS